MPICSAGVSFGWDVLLVFCFSRMSRGLVFFFFSSRRRHTRLQGDWSSDVCSSDLSLAWGHFGTPAVSFRIGGTARARGEDGLEAEQKDVDAAGAGGGPGSRAGDVERPPAGTEGRRGPRRPRELDCLDFQQR